MAKPELRQHEQQIYAILLLHTVECTICRAEEDCTQAAQIRRALRVIRLVLQHTDELIAADDE
ncbi:hypothetical protein ACFYO9_21915 [Streptomyces sp. NPDC005863]|uniref:hypothetical protein n=1 Tax=unclassified Streptomyces TaxID=2593676 RepID=UPI0033F6D331